MSSSQYNFTSLKRPVDEVAQQLMSRSATSLIHRVLDEVALDLSQVSGPHSDDLYALHWPISPTAWTKNRHGSLLGGIAFLLMDVLASLHLTAALGTYHHVTTNMQTTYIKAVQLQQPSVVKTTIVRAGGVACFMECEIVGADGSRLIKAAITKATLPKSSSL